MLKKISNIISSIIIVIVCLFTVFLILLKCIGYNSFSVLSASMTPRYNVGDLVYAKPEKFSNINIGDVIVYNANGNSIRVMHRVVEKIDKNQQFYTKGDANSSRDSNPILYGNIIGKVTIRIPKLGLVGMYLSTSSGKTATIVLVVLIIVLFIIPDLFKTKSKNEENSIK